MPTDEIPEAIGQMFIGMGLFQTGFFTLGWSSKAYGRMIAFGYLVAAPATAVLAWLIWKSDFEPLRLHAEQRSGRPPPALYRPSPRQCPAADRQGGRYSSGHGATGGGRANGLQRLSMTSIITNLTFCGYGLGLYGQLSRFQQLGGLRRLGLHPDLEQALAGQVPVRALRMALAVPGSVETPALRESRLGLRAFSAVSGNRLSDRKTL